MTSKSTVKWMKDKGYYERWIVPEAGLNSGTVYAHRPPGNSPELMPLDNNLNKDLHDAVDAHVRDCKDMEDTEDNMVDFMGKKIFRKFSRATPERQTQAYLRVWEMFPPSKRIMEDVDKVLLALPIIQEARGTTVQGICERNGKRKRAQADGVKNKRGGHRKKGKKKNLSARHPDALPARASRIAKSEKRFHAKAGEG